MVLTSGRSARFNTARDSAVRALFRGQPFDMLRKETYEVWKDIEVTFDPRDMFRG
jgi:colicin import membrane protein